MFVPSESPKILIVGPSWVGDMVMSQSLCAELHNTYQNPQIDILAPQWSSPVIARMPGVRHAVSHDIQHGEFSWGKRRQLGRSLKKYGYDQAIVIPRSWKSALIPWQANIPVRTGFLGEQRFGLLNDYYRLNKAALPTMLERLLFLASPNRQPKVSSKYYPQLITQDVTAALHKHSIAHQGGQSILALCPGAEFGDAKQWPADHYAQIAKHHFRQGWQVWLFGSKKDSKITAHINGLCQGQCTDLAGQTSLGEAIDLLSIVDLVVTNDSGLMHVACALGRRVIAIFGSSSPKYTPPLSMNADVISLDLPCQPCFKRTCQFGHRHCLTQLTPDQVIKQARL
ncbi:MAG: lipopolysaccharide heptosyltransferase II [Coxiellaceae bacterium]|nr:lipopolysaccharide heptosyltransferase II [Coxiellaceae bacterium]